MPNTSVVLRAFNEERHIGDVLQALRSLTYRDVEVILVDSGSTDRTVSIARPYCDRIITIESRDFTFGYALNVGCQHATGAYVVVLSAHALPGDDRWLAYLVDPLTEDGRVAMTYGRHVGAHQTKFSERRDFARIFDAPHRPVPPFYANNACSAIRRMLWEEHPFDEHLPGLEDIAWARYFWERGYVIRYVAEAAVHHIHEEGWPQVYNRYRREAVAARRLGLPQPPHSGVSAWQFARDLTADLIAAGTAATWPQRREIVSFRYHQYRGARDGWRRDIDLGKERYALFYSGANRGVVIRGSHDAVLQDLPMPEVKPGDVLVKVSFVGVCRTDLEIYEGRLGYYRQGRARYPIVPGHEFSGTVVGVGANGGTVRVGDRVVGEPILFCGQCPECLAGITTACVRRREVGVMNYDGAYARYLSLPALRVHVLPDDLSLEAAALVEPLAVVRKGLRRVAHRLHEGVRCAVVGAGPIGNLCAQVLARSGHRITVFDVNPARLRLLDGQLETADTLDRLTSFGLIVETTGRAEVLERLLAESRADATLLLFGLPYGPTEYNFEEIVTQDRCVVGSVGSAGEDFRWALAHLPGLDTTPFLRHIAPLSHFAAAWESCRNGAALKTLLRVD